MIRFKMHCKTCENDVVIFTRMHASMYCPFCGKSGLTSGSSETWKGPDVFPGDEGDQGEYLYAVTVSKSVHGRACFVVQYQASLPETVRSVGTDLGELLLRMMRDADALSLQLEVTKRKFPQS